MVGNVIAAFVGVCIAKAFRHTGLQWLASGLAVGLAVTILGVLGLTHPPAGATALIAVVGGPAVEHQGWLYIVQPVATGALLLLATALLFNNVHRFRSYPLYW